MNRDPSRPKVAAWRHALVLLGLAVALGSYDLAIVGNERLLRTGEVVRLELAPRDPRALLTGDYMALDYRVARDIGSMLARGDAATPSTVGAEGRAPAAQVADPQDPDARRPDPPAAEGYAVVRLDERRVAALVRLQPSTSPPPGRQERLLRYRIRDGRVALGTNAWYFEEGTAARFEPARYGEFRVGADGRMLLTTMLAEDLRPL